MNERAKGDVMESGPDSLVIHPRTVAQTGPASLKLRAITRRKPLESAACLIYAISSTPVSGFLWRWRTVDGVQHSEPTFAHFYECMADARAHGHQVDLPGTITALQAHGVTHEPDSPVTDAELPSDKMHRLPSHSV